MSGTYSDLMLRRAYRGDRVQREAHAQDAQQVATRKRFGDAAPKRVTHWRRKRDSAALVGRR